MSEEVGRSIMVMIAIAVAATLGFFIYSLVLNLTGRPVLVQVGDGIISGTTAIVYLQNSGTAPADLTGATLRIPLSQYGLNDATSTSLSCQVGGNSTCRVGPGQTIKLTFTFAPNSLPPGVNTFTGYIETTGYGAYKVTLIRA